MSVDMIGPEYLLTIYKITKRLSSSRLYQVLKSTLIKISHNLKCKLGRWRISSLPCRLAGTMHISKMITSKGHLISKCHFGVFNFFQKTNENNLTWGIIVVNLNLFILFLEETSAWKNHFNFVWPLGAIYDFRRKTRKVKSS